MCFDHHHNGALCASSVCDFINIRAHFVLHQYERALCVFDHHHEGALCASIIIMRAHSVRRRRHHEGALHSFHPPSVHSSLTESTNPKANSIIFYLFSFSSFLEFSSSFPSVLAQNVLGNCPRCRCS